MGAGHVLCGNTGKRGHIRKRMHRGGDMIGKEYIDLYVVAGKFPRFYQFRCSVEFSRRPYSRSLWARSAGPLPDHLMDT